MSVKNYNNQLISERPVKYTNYITDKFNAVHKEIFEDSLKLLIGDIIEKDKLMYGDTLMTIDQFKREHNIIEIKDSEYWEPSTVIIISKRYPFTKKTYSLENYWDYNQHFYDKTLDDIILTEENVADAEIINLDYIRGIATLESRVTGIKYDVDFDYLSPYTVISDDLSLTETFSAKLEKISK